MRVESTFVEKSIGAFTSEQIKLQDDFIAKCIYLIDTLTKATSIIAENRDVFSTSFLRLFFSRLGSDRLGIDRMSLRTPNLYPDGSVIRLDALLGDDDYPRVCDLNVSLTGYSVQRSAYELFTGKPHKDQVTQQLARNLSDTQNNFILTNAHYTANSHLHWIAARTSRYGRSPLKVVHTESNKNHRFEEGGLLIQQSREPWIIHNSGPHIYPPGSKFAEFKGFPLIVHHLINGVDTTILGSIYTPSIPAFFSDDQEAVEIFSWKDLPGQPQYVDLNSARSLIQQFLSKPSCIIKTIDTSGSKGVFHLEGSSWEKFFDRLNRFARLFSRSNLRQDSPTHTFFLPNFVLIQPVLNSLVRLGNKSFAAKLDLFFQKLESSWKFIGAGVLAKPYNNRFTLVHGGKRSKIIAIPDSWTDS